MTDADARGGESGDADECAVCDTVIDTEAWHPVASQSDPEGTRIVPFCSEECREQWLAQTAEPSAGDR